MLHSKLTANLTVAAAVARATHAVSMATPLPPAAGLAAWVGGAFGGGVAVAALAALQVAHALIQLWGGGTHGACAWLERHSDTHVSITIMTSHTHTLTVRSRLGSHVLLFSGSACPSLRITVLMEFRRTRASPPRERASSSTSARLTISTNWRVMTTKPEGQSNF